MITTSILGIILGVLGALVLLLVGNGACSWHNRVFPRNGRWWERYSYEVWNPFYKDTEDLRWKVRWNRIYPVYGFLPPSYKWNIIGFLLFLIGVLL